MGSPEILIDADDFDTPMQVNISWQLRDDTTLWFVYFVEIPKRFPLSEKRRLFLDPTNAGATEWVHWGAYAPDHLGFPTRDVASLWVEKILCPILNLKATFSHFIDDRGNEVKKWESGDTSDWNLCLRISRLVTLSGLRMNAVFMIEAIQQARG